MATKHAVKAYYALTKPGVLYGNALTAAAGFLLASQGTVDWLLFVMTLLGSTLIIASACVINNYFDQDIDRIMARTKKRPLITGEVSPKGAFIFGWILGILGVGVLAIFTSWLVVAIGVIGFIDYVFLYGRLSKRKSVHGTLVGSISGAIPILAGYVSAAGGFDMGALLVFAVLFFWQMPEFYSIAIYRRKEYKAAGIPVVSVVRGVERTKALILVYTAAFVLSTITLSLIGVTGSIYLLVMSLLGIYWLYLAIIGLSAPDADMWARRMFKFSLTILLAFCFMISVDNFLP